MENIGIFIDAENIRPTDLPYIMIEAKKFGRIIVSRIYADWSQSGLEKWKPHLVTYALEPIHCVKLPRKNSVDIKLIDDIYDILYFKNTVLTYIIVSNDVDFLTVSRKIKLFGKNLITFGYNNCNEVLKNVSDKFINISLLNIEEDLPEFVRKETLELENVFGDDDEEMTDNDEIEIRKTGDTFLDCAFEIMNGERHYNFKELRNKLKKRLNLSSEEIITNIQNKYYNIFRIGEPTSCGKEKIYDITSINSDVHPTIDEQFLAVFQMADNNEIILSQYKEKLGILINNFDQRIWGFTRFKDMIKTIFVNRFEIVDKGNSQYIKNLII